MDWSCLFFISSLAGLFLLSAGQNKPPTWDQASVNVFPQGFSEATPIGTSLAQLVCIDPENDRVIYRRKSGNAVAVNSSGLVTLQVELDYEKQDQLGYDLTFTCTDLDPVSGFPAHPDVEIRTQISVNDANDNPPVFKVDNVEGYAFTVREDAAVGTVVEYDITVSDVDRGDNAVLESLYLICNTKDPVENATVTESSRAFCTKFNLTYVQMNEGLYQANITLIGELDYEKRPVYTSKIVAIDGPNLARRNSATVNVQINVEDAQDVGPVFLNRAQSTPVSEGAQPGDVIAFNITARDGDTGDRRPIDLSIIQDVKNAFNLTTAQNTGNGIYQSSLVVRNPLDRETNLGAYAFVVKATEINPDTNQLTAATATATYSVFVLDINDNAPTFSQAVYTINVTEMNTNATSSSVQITGLHIVCSDPDEPSNAQYRVNVETQQLSTGQDIKAYAVSPGGVDFTGNASMFLKVEKPEFLDYDNPAYRTQVVVLVARETRTPELLSSTTTVSIILQDINDNSPVFSRTSYDIDIPEDTQTPTDLCGITQPCRITATDKDSGPNGQLKYRLEGGVFNKFSIDENTGVLSLIDTVDYETTPQYVFLVYATDQAAQPRSTQVQVTVNIQNVNDVRPTFSQDIYRTSVNESSLQFVNPVTLSATDTGSTGITFRLVPGDYPADAFALNPTTGVLTLLKRLNYEETPRDANGQPTGIFTIPVEASDNENPPLTNRAEVQVTVIDQNNHEPVLDRTSFQMTIPETAPSGTIVANITGTDEDGGDNGKIAYRLGAGASDNFIVEPETGVVKVGPTKSFDFETQQIYNLTIIATDGGAPQKSATASVTVTITDSNNKDPTFSRPFYQESVNDTEPVNKVVVDAIATDLDTTSSLQYSILRDTIRATDANGNNLISTQPYDYTQAFDINDQGGIYIKNELSSAAVQEIRFIIHVKDVNTEQGAGTATAQVTMVITGDVETTITFDTVAQITMNEDAPVAYRVLTAVARDPNNKPVNNYYKMSGSQYFDVLQNGEIILNQRIDYENDAEPNHAHIIIIRAESDNGLESATTTVTITLMDVNDNDPQFEERAYTARVSETDRYPTAVLTVFATDADSSSFGPLDFSITGGLDSDDFQVFLEPVPASPVVSRRAQIIVARDKVLDYNKRSQYDLDLVVGDNVNLLFSNKRNFNRARLIINVTDENNNVPKFTENSRSLAIPETARIDQSIATVVATDEDVGRNGQITYSLEVANDPSSIEALRLFRISRELGVVSVADSLLGKGNRIYRVQVRATDGGDVPSSSVMLLDITVLSTEDNDGNPKWLRPENQYTVTAPEETPGHILRDDRGNTRFFDVAPRTGTNITFSLADVGTISRDFRINSTTGEITIVGNLDREQQEIYDLLVYAEDTVDPLNIRTGRQLHVRLLDKNDNDATFQNPNNYPGCNKLDIPYVVEVREGVPVNTTVETLEACDPDSAENSEIVYALYNDNAYCTAQNSHSALLVDPEGHLTTRDEIDYETDKEFNMCVQAMSVSPASVSTGRKKRSFNLSSVNTTLHNVAYVHIVVLDVNDNGPKFPEPTNIGVIATQQDIGSFVPLNAQDPDGSGRNIITYKIVETLFYPQGVTEPRLEQAAFILRGDKAALYPARSSFSGFSGGRFEVTVEAVDSFNSSLSSRQTITIYIYEKGQTVKAVLNVPPEQGLSDSSKLVSELHALSNNYHFIYLRVSAHTSGDEVDQSKTDVCFLVIEARSHTILNIGQVSDLLDRSEYRRVEDSYNVIDRGHCYPSESSENTVKWRDLWWVLVAVGIFIFVCCVTLIVLVVLLYRRYKRYMETRKTYLVTE